MTREDQTEADADTEVEAEARRIAEQMDSFLGIDQQQPILSSSPLSPQQHQITCRLLHDRLSRCQPSQLPLRNLYSYLKTLFEPVAAHDNPVAATMATTAAPITPRSVAITLPPFERSPRATRASQCAKSLAQIDGWAHLLHAHRSVGVYDDDDYLHNTSSLLTTCILKNRAKLGIHLAEFKSLQDSDRARLTNVVATVYTELASRISAYEHDDDALALVLVHIAASWSATLASSRSSEVLSFNRHFATQFDRQYRGRAPARFLEFISRLNLELDQLGAADPKPYFRGTSIVQSSGTGKTRMVLECRHLTPLLYVCLRPSDADGNAKAGFPFPDKNVVGFFQHAQNTHPSLCDLHVACFLAAWFQELADQL